MTVGNQACELCASAGGVVLWRSDLCRVVRVDDPSYPGFCRVIWNDHIREMTDLDATHQIVLMRVVFAVEAMVRRLFAPDKINLASFGNMVPHVHWHIIPRWLMIGISRNRFGERCNGKRRHNVLRSVTS